MFPKAHLVDLLSEKKYLSLLTNPGEFADEISAIEKDCWIIVDEIQRLPNLLNEVHRLHEREKRKFALCGSSARKLKRAGVNLLGGRASLHFLHPFLPYELGEDFNLDTALKYGTIPIVWQSNDPEQTLENYTQLYIKEEIQAEATVKNLPAFARFLPISAIMHGQILNISSLARDSGAQRTTIQGYVEILEDTLLAYRLPAFESKIRVRERKHPKFYYFDSGVVRSLKNNRGSLAAEEQGTLFEGWVAQTIRARNAYQKIFDEWAYWSPAGSKTEVDFVLTQGKDLIAIEAKSTTRIRSEDYKGLRAIGELKNVKRRIIV